MNILLTGGTGVLGAVLADELAPLTDLTCLTRQRPLGLPGVRQVTGDLAALGMGLDARVLDDLIASTDVVVHCGAMTVFGSDREAAHQVNVDGTNRVLDLAARAGARLVHVSSAFVARIGEFADAAGTGVRTPLSYLSTKLAAESLVAGSGLDADIVRPSVLIGDSRTGAFGQFQGWHAMCGAVITGRTPFLPADGDVLVDCVPVDHAAQAIADLVLRGAGRGSWWLTAGEHATTLDQSLDISVEVAAERGLAPQRPRLLPREMVERLVLPAFGDGAPPKLRRQMEEGVELMRLHTEHRFPSSWPDAHLRPPASNAESQDHVRTSLRYWCDRQGLGVGTCVA